MRLFWQKKSGFLTRLGNIIIIQVLFVFVALAILLFYPNSENSVDSEYLFMSERLNQVGMDVLSVLEREKVNLDDDVIEGRLHQQFADLLQIDNLVKFYIYVRPYQANARKLFSFGPTPDRGGTDNADIDFTQLVDRTIIEHHPGLVDGLLIPIIHSSRYFVYYYQVVPSGGQPLVLVAISDHQAVSSASGQERYTFFLLFLVSALVSLLTVHLIRKRFQAPLDRLIGGFEKIQEGELYCLIESDVDDELSKLTRAYNSMSMTLWENHKQVSDNNKRLEEMNATLSESQEFLGTLIDSSPTCIVSTSPEGEIMVFNREASHVFGIDRQSAVGMDFDRLFTKKLCDVKTTKLLVSDRSSVEVLCRRGDGCLFPAYMISVPVNTKENEVWAYLHLIKDISESKNFQEMMVRLDRYYTRGEMAGDIAHEINNFLAILSGNVELMPLLMKKNNLEKIDKKLQVMKSTIDRITRFTDGLLDSGGEKVRFEQADMNQLVQTIIAFLKPQNKFDNLTVKTELSTDIPLVDIDSGQMQQLMVNLLRNASEALDQREGERSVVISTELIELNGQPGMRVKVHDNGPGVRPDKQDLLFEKRFTTKPRGHGIGLITCKRIIDTHEGSISYTYDSGALFSFELPIKNRAANTQEDVAEPAGIEIVS